MAIGSGSITIPVTQWDSLTFGWWTESQTIAENYSTVGWELVLAAGGKGYINSTRDKEYSVVVNGETYSGVNKVGIANNSQKVLVNGYTTIPHNTDGSKTFAFSFSQEFDITFSGSKVGTITGSGSGTLASIPRQATLTAAPNFTDEENPTIQYNNPAGNAVTSLMVCISLDGAADDIKFRDIDKTGTSYTFNLTEAERNLLRNATTTANSRTVVFSLATNIGGVWYYSKLYKTLTIVNNMPSFTATVKDINDSTIALTGNSGIMVKYHSIAEYAISATAYKGASIVSYSAECGGKVSNTANGSFEAVESGSFVFTVTDSRGNSIGQVVDKAFIAYSKLTCNLEAKAPTTDGDATIKISGNYFNSIFGANPNTLIVQYRIKENSGDYGSWQTAAATPEGNKYDITVNLSGLNYRNTYTFQAIAKDELEIVYSAEQTVRTLPVYDWGFNDFNFNVPVSIGGNPLNDFVVEQGISNDWFYRKWESGIAECWRVYYGSNVNASATNYNGFYYSTTITVPYPFTFVNLPCLQANGGSASNMNFVRVFGQYEDAASFIVCGLTDSATNTNITVNLFAIGKWK